MDLNFIPKSYTFKQVFIQNSNAIDPQPGYIGDVPGCPMYENHMAALDFVLNNDWELSKHTCLDIHRILTKGIPFFENNNGSGLYRDCDVYIGGKKCPPSYLLNDLMELWYINTIDLMNSDIAPEIIAWISHHMFENIHPFIDGNGRTGRLLLNKILVQLGQEPVVIYYSNRFDYYESITAFENRHFKNNKFIDLDNYLDYNYGIR